MKCPYCHLEVTEAKGEYYKCRGCHFFFKTKLVEAHQEKNLFNKTSTFYFRGIDPEKAFKHAEEKFNNDKREVIGIFMNMRQRSLLLGQQYQALIKKKN